MNEASPSPPQGVLAGVRAYLRMIKIEHSIFALPFAFVSALIAAGGVPDTATVGWITVAMVAARSAAMGMNRVIDRRIDAANPRTRNREIPAGLIPVGRAVVFIVLSVLLLLYAAARLNPLCLKLSPLALAVLFLYSYTKRFTWAAHFVLGLAIAGAPLGAWIAVTGSLDPRILLLALAVVLWLAGFDTLYALQDLEFDRAYGLHSIPQRFGVRRSILLARTFHLGAWLLLAATGRVFDLSPFYWLGLLFIALLFVHEHRLVRPGDLSKLDLAFFNMNGYISVSIFLFTLMGYL